MIFIFGFVVLVSFEYSKCLKINFEACFVDFWIFNVSKSLLKLVLPIFQCFASQSQFWVVFLPKNHDHDFSNAKPCQKSENIVTMAQPWYVHV